MIWINGFEFETRLQIFIYKYVLFFPGGNEGRQLVFTAFEIGQTGK